jgi:hypothetical protein
MLMFLAGLVIGANVGLVIAALLISAKQYDVKTVTWLTGNKVIDWDEKFREELDRWRLF